METKEKIQLIAELIKKYVESGYCIEQFIGKPISWFDEEKTKELLENRISTLENSTPSSSSTSGGDAFVIE